MKEPVRRFRRRKGDRSVPDPPTRSDWKRAEELARRRIAEIARAQASQAAFARATGLQESIVSELINPRRGPVRSGGAFRRSPRVEQLWRIGKAYDVSADW